MQSRKERQEDLFGASPLQDLDPGDHIMKRMDAISPFPTSTPG